MAAEDLNRDGFRIKGKPVKFEIVGADDKGDNETARKVAQELVDKGVHAVIGHTASSQLQVALPTYIEHNLLVMTPNTVEAKLRSAEPNTRVFQGLRFAASGEQAYPAIGVYKAEHGEWTPQARSANW